MKEISVGKSDLVSAKNRRESAKNLVFGRMGIFLAVGQIFLAFWGRFLALLIVLLEAVNFSVSIDEKSFW